MTSRQIQLIQDSWKKVLPIADQAGELFYSRLFEIAPSVRHMFGSDIKPQARKLIAILAVVVSKLDRLEDIIGQVQQLALRHNEYGVKPSHYAPVGEALLWTLEKGLGESWNEELKVAWTAAYTTLSGAMIAVQQNANRVELS